MSVFTLGWLGKARQTLAVSATGVIVGLWSVLNTDSLTGIHLGRQYHSASGEVFGVRSVCLVSTEPVKLPVPTTAVTTAVTSVTAAAAAGR